MSKTYSDFARNVFYDIINNVITDRTKSVLELGHADGFNFERLKFQDKTSVDLGIENQNNPPTFLGTTDEFFDQNTRKFDIIYIDANHMLKHVRQDYENAIKCLNPDGLIFFHDLIPWDLDCCSANGAGDGFKLLNYFIDNGYNFCSNRDDVGLTCLFTPKPIKNEVVEISYDEFIDKIKNDDRVVYNDKDFERLIINAVVA